MMVRTSDSDGTIGGAVETTSRTVGAALKIIGKAEDSSIVSSFFLIILDKPYHPKKVTLVFSDCGLVIEPTALQLSQIGQSSIQSYIDLIGGEPKVAMLSFSTYGSARHKSVRMVSEATALLKKAKPHVKIDGELQFDSAFVPSVSEKKAKGSELEGDANIMIFPNLDAANIGYKIAERIGGARAIGPILQGLSKPANDLSRGCSVDDIYDLMAVTAAQVK
jgi:phosphate acetyltransferase